MKALEQFEIWLVAGSQELYGTDALRRVEEHAREIAASLDAEDAVPVRVVLKGGRDEPGRDPGRDARGERDDDVRRRRRVDAHVLAREDVDRRLDGAAQAAPASAHAVQPRAAVVGDRHGLHEPEPVGARRPRVRVHRDAAAAAPEDGRRALAATRRSCAASARGRARPAAGTRRRRLEVARFGDNMRQVAVTEGDKVEAQMRLGRLGERLRRRRSRDAPCTGSPTRRWTRSSRVRGRIRARPGAARGRRSARVAARRGTDRGGAPLASSTRAASRPSRIRSRISRTCRSCRGSRSQRLMADGYGFGAEGDWKTAALVRDREGDGQPGSTAAPPSWRTTPTTSRRAARRVLGAHMLEVCPSIAAGRPSCEIHPLSIGGRGDPVRLVFTAASRAGRHRRRCVDLGDRFRLVVNEVDVVASGRGRCRSCRSRARSGGRGPTSPTAAEAWLVAGGPHHTVLCRALGTEAFADFAEIAGIELVVIDAETRMRDFAQRAALEPGVLPARGRPVGARRAARARLRGEPRDRRRGPRRAHVRERERRRPRGRRDGDQAERRRLRARFGRSDDRRSSTSRAARSWPEHGGLPRTRRRTSPSTARSPMSAASCTRIRRSRRRGRRSARAAVPRHDARRPLPRAGAGDAAADRGRDRGRLRGADGGSDRRDVRRTRARSARVAGCARRLARAVRVGRRRSRMRWRTRSPSRPWRRARTARCSSAAGDRADPGGAAREALRAQARRRRLLRPAA